MISINKKAKWIGLITDKETGEGNKDMTAGSPAAYLRKEFGANKNIRSAKMTVTALGIYYCYINGIAVDDELFKPLWTDYNKSLDYNVFDVTKLIKEGKNCVGIILGDGWYSGKISIVGRQYYGKYPLKLFLRIDIEYEDGSTDAVISDKNFRGGAGKIRENDFQDGEVFDNRFKSGFSEVGFDDGGYENVDEYSDIAAELKLSDASPVKYHECFKAEFLHKDCEGKYIYDIGQNLAGNISCVINAEKNDKIIFRFGEMLKDDGSLYTENLRSAKATDIFISNGEKDEKFSPLFTFHGFRYIEIDKPETASVTDIKVFACYSDLNVTGGFECDNALVNQIYKNAFWGQKSNFVGLPTDCPQRDERMGWTGDSFAFCQSAMFNMDCRQFYIKFMENLIEATRENGAVTDVVPYVSIVGYGHNGWGDVITELPYNYYLTYGDKDLLRFSLPYMKKWVDYLDSNSVDHIRPFDGYGDWLSIGYNETGVEAMNTALTARSADITAKACLALNDSDYSKYKNFFIEIRKNYRNKFIHENGTIGNDNQGDYLLACACGLADYCEIAVPFIKTVEKNNYHLSCGFMSIKFLLPTLCELGESDLAYRIINNDTYPSWGYSIKQGATTVWERWNSYTKENGFGNAEMNSFNHYSLGSCVEWYYKYVLGINFCESAPGFKKILIRPFIDKSGIITKAKGFYNSVSGLIEVEWNISGGICEYKARFGKDIKIECDFTRYPVIEKTVESESVIVKFKIR